MSAVKIAGDGDDYDDDANAGIKISPCHLVLLISLWLLFFLPYCC